MSWLSKFLGLDKEEKPIEEDLGEDTGMVCDYCKMSIHDSQKYKTYGGKKFHLKPCWYKLRKDAKSQMFK